MDLETFFPRRNQRYFFINIHTCSFNVSIILVTFQVTMKLIHRVWKKIWIIKIFKILLFWDPIFDAGVRTTNGRIYGKAFKRTIKFIRDWRNAQYLSLCHKFKTFTRHVLTSVWLQGAELENGVTVVVNC